MANAKKKSKSKFELRPGKGSLWLRPTKPHENFVADGEIMTPDGKKCKITAWVQSSHPNHYAKLDIAEPYQRPLTTEGLMQAVSEASDEVQQAIANKLDTSKS